MVTSSCPRCGQDSLRPASALGWGLRRDPRWDFLMFRQAPLGLGMAVLSLAGWSFLIFIAFVLGLENLRTLSALIVLALMNSAYQGFRWMRPGPASAGPGVRPSEAERSVCLVCDGALADDSRRERFPVERLGVSGAAQARDRAHLRALALRPALGALGELCVPVFCLLMGLGLSSAAGWALWRSAGGMPILDMRSVSGIAALVFLLSGAVMAGGMGLAFLALWRPHPLLIYQFRPEGFLLASAELRSKQRHGLHNEQPLASLEIRFSDAAGREILVLEPYADVDRYFASEGEDAAMRPEDDGYELVGKRSALPVPAWVLYEREDPWNAVLVGIPKAVAERLRPLQAN